ncbi:hypothetical protein SAMN05216308_10652 [Nitrosospira sp. Nsp13]|nr:hypothetical protein SAMN05216308_10652 [Nitrosospira sp. Nsp13]
MPLFYGESCRAGCEDANLIKPILKTALAVLPDKLRRKVEIMGASLSNTLENWWLPGYRVEGELGGDGGRATLLYFGDLPQYNQWSHHFFTERTDASYVGKFRWIDAVRRKSNIPDYDLALFPVNPLTEPISVKMGWHIIPLYVSCVLDLTDTTENLIRSQTFKQQVKAIRAKNYQIRELSADSDLEDFYHEMLLPTIKERHGEVAFTSGLESLKSLLQEGRFFGLYRDTEWIAGRIVCPEGLDELRLAVVGWKNGDEKLLREGVVTAILVKTIDWARSAGFKRINLGSSIPFINDGPLNAKLRWKAKISMPQTQSVSEELQGVGGFVGADFKIASNAGRAILRKAPLLEKHGRTLRVIGWESNIKPEFRHQFDLGMEWVDLAVARNRNGPYNSDSRKETQ